MKRFDFIGFIKKRFAIEYDVDITDDTAMLYRRNIVVKNIIFFSNLVYTLIFFILSISDKTQTNIVITIILLPVTFVVNHTLKRLIMKDAGDAVKQQIASYFCVFYMFLTAILLYVKMRSFSFIGTERPIYSDAAYVLIYYALVVISLYQNATMIKNITPYVLVGVTILHFVTTHDVVNEYSGSGALEFIKNFLKSEDFRDIIVRTVMLAAFLIVLYAVVYLSSRLQEQRKTELLKRQSVQDDFTKVVVDMFDITINGNQIPDSEHAQGNLLETMCTKLSSIVGLSPNDTEKLRVFSTIHLKAKVDLDVSGIEDKDLQFEKLREQTSLGNEITRRLELRRKRDDIIRAHTEGWSNDAFVRKTKEIQNNTESLIILLCELYITLRSPNNYKRPFSHDATMNLINQEFKVYFTDEILDRFVRFANDFEDLFNNYKEESIE